MEIERLKVFVDDEKERVAEGLISDLEALTNTLQFLAELIARYGAEVETKLCEAWDMDRKRQS